MLAHVIAGEGSRARLSLLKSYARHEVRLLAILYRVLSSRMMSNRIASECLYWALAYPSAKWGIVGTPLSPRELEGFLAEGSRVAVGPCRCRLAHGACDHPVRTDIVVRSGFPIWTGLFPDDYEEITRAEALAICRDCHEQGLVQIAYAHLDTGSGGSCFVICNCCSDGCLPLLTRKHYGSKRYPFHRGLERAIVEEGVCEGCGRCLQLCAFEARVIGGEGKASVGRCYGCGLCVTHCPTGASRFV
jgi:ferredoxin